MSLSYYDERQRPQTRIASGLALFNACTALLMVFYWSGVAGFIGEPFKWAMRDDVGLAPTIFDYPYLTLWLTPLLCMCGGWLAIQAERFSLARIIGAYPPLMLTMMTGWYYLT